MAQKCQNGQILIKMSIIKKNVDRFFLFREALILTLNEKVNIIKFGFKHTFEEMVFNQNLKCEKFVIETSF